MKTITIRTQRERILLVEFLRIEYEHAYLTNRGRALLMWVLSLPLQCDWPVWPFCQWRSQLLLFIKWTQNKWYPWLRLFTKVKVHFVNIVMFYLHRNVISVKEVYAVKQGSGLLKVTSPEVIIGFDGHPIFIIKVRKQFHQEIWLSKKNLTE